MAAQPANTDIKVYLTVRSRRDIRRTDSVAALIKRLRDNIAVIPGKEMTFQVLARDTNVRDFSPYMGEARPTAVRGFPIVVGLRDEVDMSEVQTMDNVDFAFVIGQDTFVKSTQAGLTGDLFGDAQDLV